MKKIKTIIEPIERPDIFDKRVNILLTAGWDIINRKLISVMGEPNEVGSAGVFQALYAEFEKEG